MLDEFIQRGMQDWKVPGLSALVVKEGQVVFKKAYGVKDIVSQEPVDSETTFNMASTTKAIVAICLAMLVDEGMIQWNDPVKKHYPAFDLSDPYIRADARVQDLLTHNLGMGNADALWIFDSLSTDETLERFAAYEPTYPLRGGFVYQNIMYAIAGKLIEEVSGKHWTEFVRDRVFEPLGMSRTVARSPEIFEKGNYVTPHWDDSEDGVVRVPYTLFDNVGAAGILWSCIDDMARYMTFLQSRGVVEGDTLLLPSTFDYLFKPHSFVTAEQFYPTQELTKPRWTTYGLGWFQHDYRGEKLNFHTGSIAGLVALAAFIPERNIGLYVFANLDHAELRHAIMYKALDLYLFGDDGRDWHQEIFDLYRGFKQDRIAEEQALVASRIPATAPLVALDSLAGTYMHERLGTVAVRVKGEELEVQVNGKPAKIAKHWHHNVFRTEKDPRWRNRTLINFRLGGDGRVADLVYGSTEGFRRQP